MIFGYARVSSVDQNLDRQLKELRAYGCERIYYDKQSGKDFSRSAYREMRDKMRFGDVFVVHDGVVPAKLSLPLIVGFTSKCWWYPS